MLSRFCNGLYNLVLTPGAPSGTGKKLLGVGRLEQSGGETSVLERGGFNFQPSEGGGGGVILFYSRNWPTFDTRGNYFQFHKTSFRAMAAVQKR